MRGIRAILEKILPRQVGVQPIDADLPTDRISAAEDDVLIAQSSQFWTLRFPSRLEVLYRKQFNQRMLRTYRLRTPFILILYLVLVIGVIKSLPPNSFFYFLLIDIWIPATLIAGWFLTLIKRWDRWYQWYTAGGSMLVLATTIIVANVFHLGQGLSVAYAAIMYSVLIVYSYVGLHFLWAIMAGWAGGVLGVALTYHLGGEVDWAVFHRTYTCTSVLGMGIAYALERQERQSFLQMCMLQISVAKSSKLAQQLEDLSLTDALTGLANRRHLDESLDSEWKRASRHEEPLTVMMVDVDFFKPFNDKFGHVAGDQCLRQIATALSSFTHRSGELAARYGGEEFVLLYPMMTAAQAGPHAQKLLDRIQGLAIPNVSGEPVTVSIGIATCSWIAGTDVATLLRQADEALYDAKENGRNRYEVYHDESTHPVAAAPI